MDILSLYYFSELAKDLHMTRTANRLFISQQTLSNHIQRLEEYYETQLLHRKPTLSLTCAGEFVLGFADVVSKEHTNLKDILSDVEQQERGAIHFGASPLRLNALLPNILPQFSARYPNVEIHITDTFSAQLEPMVLKGDLDFAIILSDKANSKLVEDHLLNDKVYLCVSNELLKLYYGAETEALKEKAIQGANVSEFSKLPFCLHSNRLGMQIWDCFEEHNIRPKIYTISSDTKISLSLCFQRLAACFATHMRLIDRCSEIPNDLNIFPLYYQGEPLTQKLSLIRHKKRYLAHYSKLFLDLLFQYFSEIEQVHLSRKV